jgi:hypothetical protein
MTARKHAAHSLAGSTWERPNYFGPLDAPQNYTTVQFKRGGWWQHAVDEARAIRDGVGDRRHCAANAS